MKNFGGDNSFGKNVAARIAEIPYLLSNLVCIIIAAVVLVAAFVWTLIVAIVDFVRFAIRKLTSTGTQNFPDD